MTSVVLNRKHRSFFLLLPMLCSLLVFNGHVRFHQIPAIPVFPESESWSASFDYIIPELEWPEFDSADSGQQAEF